MSFARFGLIVTGRGEAKFLPTFFRALEGGASCIFEIIRKSEQLRPITSERRRIKMVGRGRTIPNKDVEQYGLPAHAYLRRGDNRYVLVVDDLEAAGAPMADAVFSRYRAALDAVLDRQGRSGRAAVHFFVYMIEAYYFAHAQAVNGVAGRRILAADHEEDVELIRHPKSELKKLWTEFDEVVHGAEIVANLNLNHVLRTAEHCCWLRSMFGWCIDRLQDAGVMWDEELHDRFQLREGNRAPLTMNQKVGSA